MAFRVGQKVVCVNDVDGSTGALGAGYTNGLRNGTIYTITHIERGEFFALLEIKEPGWHKSRFRPAVERKTDISIFTALLTPNKRERADA